STASCHEFYAVNTPIGRELRKFCGWWGSERLEHGHRGVVAPDSADAAAATRARTAQQHALVGGRHSPALRRGREVGVVLDEGPVEPPVEDVARGQVDRALKVEGRLRLDARVPVRVAQEQGQDR